MSAAALDAVPHRRPARFALVVGPLALALAPFLTPGAPAEAGPPFLTNDPGTPGNSNWEINLAATETAARGAAGYQLPQVDINYGLGERVQLTFEIPYALQSDAAEPRHGGWGNAWSGIKWRFLDQGESGWQMSLFPQIETAGAPVARAAGVAVPGPRYYLPLEASRKVGPLEMGVEVGYFVAGRGSRERTFGLLVGRLVTARLELDAEIYDDRADGALPHSTSLDVGGRYKLGTGFMALFMFGRSINGLADGQPEFMAYLGLQILLADYGRRLLAEP